MKSFRLALVAPAAICCAAAVGHAAMVPPPGSAPAEHAAVAPISAPSAPFWVEQVAEGLNMPWSMAWLPNGDMLIVEKYGGVRLLRKGKLQAEPITGVPAAFQSGQNGLLDIALDPDFKTNQRVFLSFTEGTAEANRGALYRARFDGKGLVDGKVIFRTRPDSRIFPYPLAGRMLFLPDKTLLLTSTDDHGRRHLAQQLDNHISKIIRIDRDGQAPDDNPFVDKPGAWPEIYAYGVRAPLGLTRNPKTGEVWEIENGPRGGDELNLLKPGANYGWPVATYGAEYTGEKITDVKEAPGIESPTVYWVPSIAPSSVAYNTSDRYPQWKGDFFVGALIQQHLRRVRVQGGKSVEEEVMLKDLKERIRDVRVGPDGYIYVLTDNSNGRLLRIKPGQPKASEQALVAKALTTPGPNLMAGFPPRLAADAGRGRKVYEQKCMSCHAVEPTPGRIGPHLQGVFGRKAAAVPGFKYSPAMQKADLHWSEQFLDYFLSGPQTYVPETTMGSPPVTDRQERVDLIAYMKQISPK